MPIQANFFNHLITVFPIYIKSINNIQHNNYKKNELSYNFKEFTGRFETYGINPDSLLPPK